MKKYLVHYPVKEDMLFYMLKQGHLVRFVANQNNVKLFFNPILTEDTCLRLIGDIECTSR